jgi:hypothetical protein
MNQIGNSLKITFVRLIKYIFQSSEERSVMEVRLIRERYEQLGVAKLQDMLISYKSQVQHSQLLFTGIMLAMFTALLGGLGQTIINCLRQLLIINTLPKVKTAETLNMLTTDEMKSVLLIEGLIIMVFIFILILGIILFVDKIKTKQMKVLILEDIIKRKTQNG